MVGPAVRCSSSPTSSSRLCRCMYRWWSCRTIMTDHDLIVRQCPDRVPLKLKAFCTFSHKSVQKLRILVTACLHVQALGGRLFFAAMTSPLLLVTRGGRMVRPCLDSLLHQWTLARHDRHPNPDWIPYCLGPGCLIPMCSKIRHSVTSSQCVWDWVPLPSLV